MEKDFAEFLREFSKIGYDGGWALEIIGGLVEFIQKNKEQEFTQLFCH
jgi:hypothetical protein